MVGLANPSGDVYFLQMRPGLKSLAPEEENRTFMQLNALFVFGACERLSQWSGAVMDASIRYEKVIMYLCRLNGNILMLTVEKDEALETIPEIIGLIQSQMQNPAK
jgi:hypothetical protein